MTERDAIWRAVRAGVLHGWTERAQIDPNRGGVDRYERAVAIAEAYASAYVDGRVLAAVRGEPGAGAAGPG